MNLHASTVPVRTTRRAVIAGLGALAIAPRAWAAGASPRIVATTGMIADAARSVSGLPVTGLMGPGIDPHSWRATRDAVAALAQADLILWHGLNLEAQLAPLLADLSARKPVVALAEALPADRLLADPAAPGQFDPHLWFDPDLWTGIAAPLTAALDLVLPGRAGDHAAGAEAFRADAARIGAYAHQVLASVPEERRVLVTAHDAFGYFGRAYGWQVEGIQGISTESEAGLARIGDLVALIAERRIPAVFVESSVPARAVRALVEGAAARGHAVAIGGELFSDAMGVEGTYEGTWVGMIDHNATTIARALGGQAPARGHSGRLTAGA
ncbi:MAG TPA: zinc ABC transporter substrate-binding protein [Paracoccaceae bacterium]|nr:zinc ABC transporter substrate-binding protein [Paracoccaceae bacterium]HMO70544.1 zinc ABC transporter substrate-binding protein [Paracoccaceae bacterium]